MQNSPVNAIGVSNILEARSVDRKNHNTLSGESIMKKYYSSLVLICICLMAACLLPQYAHADAPQDLALSYNMQTQTLTVTITHKSFFTGTHYIKQVEIKKNNEPAGKNDYTSQPGKTTFVYTYQIPAAVNDILEVTASCNIQGKKTATLKVNAEKK